MKPSDDDRLDIDETRLADPLFAGVRREVFERVRKSPGRRTIHCEPRRGGEYRLIAPVESEMAEIVFAGFYAWSGRVAMPRPAGSFQISRRRSLRGEWRIRRGLLLVAEVRQTREMRGYEIRWSEEPATRIHTAALGIRGADITHGEGCGVIFTEHATSRRARIEIAGIPFFVAAIAFWFVAMDWHQIEKRWNA